MNPRIALLSERQSMAYTLRKSGLTFREIGERMKIRPGSVRNLYRIAEWMIQREPYWTDGLSTRAAVVLLNMNIHTPEKLREAYENGTLAPGRVRNYGWKSHQEVSKLLGLPEPQKSAKPKTRKDVLLKAAYDLLKKADSDHFVQQATEIVVHYDDADCDGACLMEDIATELNL